MITAIFAAFLLALALAAPVAADDPRTWMLWRLDYVLMLGKGNGARVPEQTVALEGDLTRTECEIIKQGRVAEARAQGFLNPKSWPNGASVLDMERQQSRITEYWCSKTTPSNPPVIPKAADTVDPRGAKGK